MNVGTVRTIPRGRVSSKRRDAGIAQEAFWGTPARNTRDRATALMPRLLYERLDELGFDFTVLYPTAGLLVPRIEDDELRRATARAASSPSGFARPDGLRVARVRAVN